MKNSKSAREEFLNNEWIRYPTRPVHHQVAGRIVNRTGTQIELFLTPNVRQIFEMTDSVATTWADRLCPGDWISVQNCGQQVTEICLLAPFFSALSYDQSKASLAQVSAVQARTLQQWSLFQGFVREFFLSQDFLEVQTPTLVICPGTEPHLDVFETQFQQGRRQQKLFLPTSPELHLKKALARGIPRLFEMRSCFRNGEISATHQPEFWMLEWYRSFEDLSSIKRDVENLVQFLIQKMQATVLFTRPQSLSLGQLFQSRCGFELTPATQASELVELCQRLGIGLSSTNYDFDDLFFLIFLEKIELTLATEGPLFVEKYPPSQAALARLTADGWGDRFEFYWHGLELANAFHELNDPVVQRERILQDLAKKKTLGKPPVFVDEEFLSYLDAGLPPSSGIALGLERLFLILTGSTHQNADISALRLFPFV